MARVKLIVTGDMEKLALHQTLARVFGDIRVNDKGVEEEVVWDRPRKLPGATSYRLTAEEQGGKISQPMKDLAKAMCQEAGIGVSADPADLVLVVDDVELGNLDQMPLVVQHFRRAMQVHLDQYELQTRARYTQELQRRCSFHLLMPMSEAYFYRDPEAMTRAGVAPAQQSMLKDQDVEQFESADPAWLPTCAAENARRHGTCPWWRHERHPKHYLVHLVERTGGFYEETSHGRDALRSLDWARVPATDQATPVIRALFQDLADWMGVPNPIGDGLCHPALYPTRDTRRDHLLLRNL